MVLLNGVKRDTNESGPYLVSNLNLTGKIFISLCQYQIIEYSSHLLRDVCGWCNALSSLDTGVDLSQQCIRSVANVLGFVIKSLHSEARKENTSNHLSPQKRIKVETAHSNNQSYPTFVRIQVAFRGIIMRMGKCTVLDAFNFASEHRWTCTEANDTHWR